MRPGSAKRTPFIARLFPCEQIILRHILTEETSSSKWTGTCTCKMTQLQTSHLMKNLCFTWGTFRTKEAQEVYEKALFYDRNNPDIYYNVSINYRLCCWNQKQSSTSFVRFSITLTARSGSVGTRQTKPSIGLPGTGFGTRTRSSGFTTQFGHRPPGNGCKRQSPSWRKIPFKKFHC